MLKRVLMVAVAATAISVPAVAGAASSTAKHKAKAHPVSLTVTITDLNPPGAVLASGSQTYSGSADGTVGGKTLHGAVIGTNTYTGLKFTGPATVFGPQGSVSATAIGTGAVNPTTGVISFTGPLKIKGGTGIYKGAKGTLTFTGGTTNKDADGDNDAIVASFKVTGSIKY